MQPAHQSGTALSITAADRSGRDCILALTQENGRGWHTQIGTVICSGPFLLSRADPYCLRFCVIYIDSDALERVAKVWVPHHTDREPIPKFSRLWYTIGKQIPNYIHTFGNDWTPEKCLLMSWIDDKSGRVQLLIPPALIAPSGALGLSAVCKEHKEDLPDRAGVNYDDWQENIGGNKGPQP